MSEIGDWFDDEAKTVDTTTLANFEMMINDYLKVQDEKSALEDQVSAKNVVLQKMLGKLKNYFEAQGLTSFKTRGGILILNQKTMYKAPEGEEREVVMQALRDGGMIDQVMGFNAGKFSSWYSAQTNEDKNFRLPGVRLEETVYMSFRKAK